MKAPSPAAVRAVLFVLFVVTLVCLPFVIWGEDFVFPLLHSREQQTGALTLIAIALLASDSVAPVPSTVVIMTLAWKAGWAAGIIGGTIGMAAGVLAAGWIGRAAVGRIAPKFLPDAELARMRDSLQNRLTLTLACLRSVPVLAETSVILAAATGVPVRRIFWATLLPNFIISTIYSVSAAYSKAAEDSLMTAAVTFIVIMILSYAVWRIFGRNQRTAG
jgi:3-dehydroquinate synthase